MEINKTFGIKTENERETRQPVCSMSIKYHKGGSGYLSYYYLSMYEQSVNYDKHLEYSSVSFELYANMNTSILLKVVSRASAKVQKQLEDWLAENAIGLMQSWCFGMSRNMKHVYNYVIDHALADFDTKQYQRTDKLPGIQLLHADYYAKTGAWWKLTSVQTDEELAMFVNSFISDYANDYKAITELYVSLSWMTDILHGKNTELRDTMIYKCDEVRQYFYEHFKYDDAAQDYFFNITD